MKQYVTDKHIRLIGKGWEVRRQLAAYMDSAGNDSLLRFSCLRAPVVAAIGRPSADRADVTCRKQLTSGLTEA